ncbi:hypothetical protein ACWGCP_21245, partial [Streptomyces niveus]
MTTGGDTGSPGPGAGGPHGAHPAGRGEPDGPQASDRRGRRNEGLDAPAGRNGAEPPDRPKPPARQGHGRN